MKKSALFLEVLLLVSTGVSANPVHHYQQQQNVSIAFTENKGQVGDQYSMPRPDVLFSGSAGNSVFHLRKTGVSYQFNRVDEWKEQKDKFMRTTKEPVRTTIYRLDINWRNANTDACLIAENPVPGYSNYYCMVAPQGVTDVKAYGDVIYKAIYPGINLHYYGKDGNLKYDFIVSPGADYRMIQLEIGGAENITINEDGSVRLETPLGTFEEGAPFVYQGSHQIPARWIKSANTLAFEIGEYDPEIELVIDPLVRNWGTWYGGTGEEYILGCATDGSGNSYICGQTGSTVGSVIATVGAHMYSTGASNWVCAFLAKFNTNGTRQWGTYYGFGGSDMAYSCVANNQGEVYMTGRTTSLTGSLIATPGAHQSSLAGGSYYYSDAFLVKFNSSGVRMWGTYYGGVASEVGRAVTLDKNGNVYMAGSARSTTGIATPGTHQPTYGGGNQYGGDGFLVKFNSTGVRQWGTYYGGSAEDEILSVDADTSGNIFIVGYTASYNSSNIASAGAHQTVYAGGNLYVPWDGFVARFNTNGLRQWGTYYGGNAPEAVYDCKGDGKGNVYFVGGSSTTTSLVIATPGAHEPTLSGPFGAAFLVKFNASGVRQWGTYFGAGGSSSALTCALNSSGNVYIAGQIHQTSSTWISTPASHQITPGGAGDGYLALFDPNGVRLEATYYGGNGDQIIFSCATNSLNQVYCAGHSSVSPGTGVATPGSHQPVYGGANDGFLVQFTECTTPPPAPVDSTDHSVLLCEGTAATLQIVSTGTVSWYATAMGNTSLATGHTYTTPPLSAGSHTWYAGAKSCNSISQLVEVVLNVDVCAGITDTWRDEKLVRVYPNPGTGKYIIENTEEVSLKLFGASGQLLLEERLLPGKNSLSLDEYPHGIYLIQFMQRVSIETVKLIKN